MRFAVLAALFLAACSREETSPKLQSGSFAGAGRDRFCIANDAQGQRAGLIIYGTGDSNCSVHGRLASSEKGVGATLVPHGDRDCRLALMSAGDRYTIASVSAACEYYCGPGARFSSQRFEREVTTDGVTDFTGEALC